MNWKTKYKIRLKVTSLVNSGRDKMEVLNDLNEEYGFDPFFERILSDIPSKRIKEKYLRISYALIGAMISIALIKANFLFIGIAQAGGSPFFLMFTTLLMQLVLVWVALKPTRLGLLMIAFYSGIQIFEYYQGIGANKAIISRACSILLFLFAVGIVLSLFLYKKFEENWFTPNKSLKKDG